MVVWRRWVFPILLVIVFGIIAAALAKLAFFDSEAPAAGSPHAMISEPVVPVERGSVTNELQLSGKIARDQDVVVRSPNDGTISEVHVWSGQYVEAGQALFTLVRADNERRVDIVAPEAGTLSEVQLVAGQGVSAGGETIKLSPARFHLLSTVQPVQLYRLLGAPSEGTVTITGGPAPFTCAGLTTQVSDDGTTSVRCSVPTDQIVFPGLPAELSISVGVADDVLLIPTTSVKGGSGTGQVWVDRGDGSEPEQRDVKLGITDGTLVEVTEGLEEGELIRQFVPGFMAPVEEVCWEVAPGVEHCETGVNW